MAEPTIEKSARIRRQVTDAVRLLDHAIQSGFRSADGRAVPDHIIAAVQAVAAKAEQDASIGAAEWLAFEVAYYDLTRLMSPITAETLRDTEGTSQDPDPTVRRGRSFMTGLGAVILGTSPANRFTRVLWFYTLAFGIFIIGAEWYLEYTAQQGDQRIFKASRSMVELLLRPAYGGLGACVYLLRSAHAFIHQRSFDIRRKPEYFNRILLGTIAGGAIILFVNQLVGEEGSVVQLSSAALGFLAGYSTDFLFNTIERVIAAILPKVGIESTRRANTPSSATMDFKDVADRHDKATGADKAFYKALLEQMTGARGKTRRGE
jgi:hypothetical protein